MGDDSEGGDGFCAVGESLSWFVCVDERRRPSSYHGMVHREALRSHASTVSLPHLQATTSAWYYHVPSSSRAPNVECLDSTSGADPARCRRRIPLIRDKQQLTDEEVCSKCPQCPKCLQSDPFPHTGGPITRRQSGQHCNSTTC